MSEVSCKVFDAFFREAHRKGLSDEALLAGAGLDARVLRQKNQFVTWRVFCQVMSACREVWKDDGDFIRIGTDMGASPLMRYLVVVGRLLFTAGDFYRWMNDASNSAGDTLFRCVSASYRDIGPGEIHISLTMKKGFAPSREFFLTAQGSFEIMSEVLGYGRSRVELTIEGDSGLFKVFYPKGGGLLAWLKRVLLRPLAFFQAGRELKNAHEDLNRRYAELEQAHAALETAHTELENARLHLEDRVAERTSQLASALDQVKVQQAARQRIFQNISHELRTPLSLIGLSTGDISYRDGEHLTEKSKERLGQIDDSIHRLLHLFDGMLLLAAGQEGKLRIKPRQTDIAITLRSLVSAWQLAAEKHGIELHYEGLDRLTVCVDEAGLERLVSNLLSNAVKFTPQAGSVEVRLEELEGARFRITVQDSGVGMDDEFLGRVFGRFEQGPAPVRTGERGSGIGLAIVKEIAEAHGGSATVASERGRGSTFMVTLPREQDLAKIAAMGDGAFIPGPQEVLPEREAAPNKGTADVSPSGKLAVSTVLVAEDDPTLRQFLVELLSRDYRVLAAGDGIAALRLAKEHHPAILVSDVGMPGFDGFELTRRFRQLNGDRLAPVILLTAYALPESRLQGLEAGAIDYVTKPFHPEELLARVKAQLQLRDVAMRLHETQRLAGLGILAAGLAHELRNPANGVVNAIGPLKKMLPAEVLLPGTSTALLLDAMTTGAEQIAVLTKQLLGFSRQGELDVRDEPMNRILESAEALVEPALAGRRVRRDLGYTDKVRCARGLVVQVLVNMLENAAHASPPGSEISLSTRLENGLIMFDVRDSGPGVPKELRDRIFDPFFTTKAPGQGTGLGLTISKMIADRHGGTLRVLDVEKGGAFRLELPAERVALPKTSPVLEHTSIGVLS